ncbi:hypothetical protein BY458DRAFT_513972 [Sporodiniella umbellata]|nr:hypothetical protein BY458DRAFT_513972 [Sporodiniella umbellata]
MSYFSEQNFCDFAKQLKNRESLSSDWEIYEKTADFVVYRKIAAGRNDKLYQYRAIGGWTDVKPLTLANTYLDLEFRKKWDKNLQSYQYFEQNGQQGIHFEIKYPWPLSNRDYTYIMEKKHLQDKDGNIYLVILGESLPETNFNKKKGVVRIDTYMQHICIAPNKDGCFVYLDYFDDPKGNIPKSVINWAAKIAVPAFVNSLKTACLEYTKEHPEDGSLSTLEFTYF